jgi:hypothetical protein
MAHPPDIERHGDIYPLLVHAVNKLLSGDQFGSGGGIKFSKTGVLLQIVFPAFPYIGRENMGVKIYYHAWSIANPLQPRQAVYGFFTCPGVLNRVDKGEAVVYNDVTK